MASSLLDSSLQYLEPVIETAKQHVGLTIGASAALYIIACNALRFQRVRWWEKHLPYKTRDDYSRMTAEHAREITHYIAVAEFPWVYLKGMQFALFRTYGIPTISKLLVATKQLSSRAHATKRYADTEMLLGEFTTQKAGSERSNAALARLNYIHGVYQKKGQITNDDMLYTLSMFALEPKRWIARYEWREVTPLELCAFGTEWKEIGDAMNISYEPLPSYEKGWKDGLHWVEELDEWASAYEERCMVPNKWNHQTAEETTAMLLYTVPEWVKPIGRNLVSTLMDDRLRKAMMYPAPPPSYPMFVNTIFRIRKFIHRYLSLPRPWFLRLDFEFPQDKKTGRLQRKNYEHDPWYVKPSLKNRWGKQAWMNWMNGMPAPGDGGDKFWPQGVHYSEIGPASMLGKGAEEVEATKAKLMSMKLGGCPFAMGKAT
ncbi:hypothetical protein NA57DRAFT_46130 [Rhizodiscina lignyota]|uniref:ER-bound oxygenase mpaB/mpaB'/Rubber oxygenase catalytic domain-containing protein n=1 Tax=Rhizodiscina lignyota TaxID=1504668 RepID=A0A9P4I8U5_9PEZI|nr:hypothetical protein NA57DRAFT_46130 [Rhizodiscina lignyota]